MRVLFRLIALVALGAAAIGLVLPGIPTVPFLLVAAWAGSRGWPALERRLLEHPRAGPAIEDWRRRRAIPRGAKIAATAMMVVSVAGLWWTLREPWPVALLAAALTGVAGWIWSRPGKSGA